MKKVVKLKGITSKETRQAYLSASEEERDSLRSQIEKESHMMIDRMAEKGYRLEATVAAVFGVFTRGAAAGTIKLLSTADRSPTP